MQSLRKFRGIVVSVMTGVLLGSLPGCTALDTGTVFSPPGTTTKIIIVRHANRDKGGDSNPPLNDDGVIRAQDLADRLENEGVTAVFYPALVRNRQTADPLLERVDADRNEYNVVLGVDTKALANRFVDDVLRDYAGGVVLWIGNTGPEIPDVQSGNLQEIYNRLGGTGDPPVDYSDLYIVTLHDDAPPTFEMETYGAPITP